MSNGRDSTDEIKQRIEPILKNVAVDGLRAWLKTVRLSSSAYTRVTISDLIAKQIAEGQLTEPALEQALIGFEEASDMRVYLFHLEGLPASSPSDWLPAQLNTFSIPLSPVRSFAGEKIRPMTPIYAQLEGSFLRVKWAERHERFKLDDTTFQAVSKPIEKRAVLIVDFEARTAELRLNPPENKHSHEDAGGRITAEAYYQAYITKTRDVLNCALLPVELRQVVKTLVEELPRVIRIHIDNHTNQKNGKMRVNTSRDDVRDDPDWQSAYERNGESWAWDNQSFYWLPEASSKLLARELFSHIDAEDGYVKVNADCSDEEVQYVVSQIRAR